jgi:glycosyltransferase involved in cell wall biosynthesis
VPWPIQTNGPVNVRSDDNRQARLQPTESSRELSHVALLETMRRASILASPAVYEPFGLTVLEAAAAGCALVLSDIQSFRELWDGAALFAEPRDPAEWQATLTYLTRNDALRKDLQKRAAQRAQCYPLKATVDAYIALYREIASNGRAIGPRRYQSLAEARP